MSHALIRVEQQDDVAVLQLNRPDKRNALNNQLIGELIEYFSAPPAGVRVVVLHAQGEHFCAGLDLFEMLASREAQRNVIRDQRRSDRKSVV